MQRRTSYLSLAVIGVLAAVCLCRRPRIVLSQSAASPLADDGVVSLRVRFGVNDTEPKQWDGSLTIADGELLGMRNWHPRPGDRVDKTDWTLATRRGANFVRRPWEEEQVTPAVPYLSIPGLIVDVKALAETRIAFQTRNGSFEVEPRSLAAGAELRLLNGSVAVDRVPSAELLSPSDYQNDFPTMLGGRDGEVWLAWVAYRNHGDEVLARRFDGTRWEESQKVTEKPSDIFLAKTGRDRNGNVWVV